MTTTSNAADDIRHPIFARMYMRFSRDSEARGGSQHRDELLSALTGRVIEIGAGHGLNFSHYPQSVDEVVAVEPEPTLRANAQQQPQQASMNIEVSPGAADRLPFATATFDAGVASLVLCTVPSPSAALAELHRVIRPGGELRFYEHVRADTRPLSAVQRGVDVIWPYVSGGCHTHRDTLAAIEQAGFVIERCRRFKFRPAPGMVIVEPHMIGVARRA